MYRISAILMFLAAAPFAVDTQDIAGMWRGVITSAFPDYSTEAYFQADGYFEARVAGDSFGTEFQSNTTGNWYVRGDSLWTKSTYKWTRDGNKPAESSPGDSRYIGVNVKIPPGNPKRMQTTDCPGITCLITDFNFVSTDMQFTLPAVGPGASIRRPAKPEYGLRSSGIDDFPVFLDGRLYDLLGRNGTLRVR